ncbi:mucin-binding protein [Lactobacillus sp. PV034]|uniref:mucin-binding protein n=1 Tax=Lactobacillus sp. PV034 TaxID=2594495 RepID=UPI00223F007B|nr:MucBP domain-containing protein [Lactobacillus sp. PV034]QNQ81423.1 YSIRK-type signal peptide-containing protein [Lactobacillus sp. PV034]
MVSKNNKVKKFEQSAQRQNHFSIRKLTVGAASVLLGTSLYFGTQTSQAHAAVESESDVKTTEVAKSEAPASSAAAMPASAANQASSAAISSVASSAVSSAASQASSAALSSAASDATTSSAVDKKSETTTQEFKINKDAKKVDSKKLENALKESKAATTDSTSGVNPLSVLEDYDDDNWDGTEYPGQPGEDGVPDVWQKKYHVKITMINALTGEVMDPKTSGDPKFFVGQYYNNTGVYNRDELAIDSAGDFAIAPYGWKLLNPEEVAKNFQVLDSDIVMPDDIAGMMSYPQGSVIAKKGNVILKTMNDVDMTLYFAPISPVEIKYVAEEQDENGNTVEKNLITYTIDNSNTFGTYTNPWPGQETTDVNGIPIPLGDTPINAYALHIPGFDLIGDATWSGVDTQSKTKDGTNPVVVTFKYKKNSQNEDSKSLTGGALIPSDATETIGGGEAIFNLDYDKYRNYNAPINATFGEQYPGASEALAKLIEQQKKQGWTTLADSGQYKADEVPLANAMTGRRDLTNNQAVTVHYVDQDGNKLADDVILASNPNNPDQTNQGVNPAENWYPEGDWTAPQKKIDGYHVTKTYGEDHGKFMPWAYEVTFEYAKDATPEEAKITVNYIDQTDNNKVLQTVPIQGTIGSAIKYDPATTIKAYEGAGYELVSNGFTEAGKEYSDANNGKSYDIIFKHGTQPVNPENPGAGYTKTQLQDEVTRTITYVGAEDASPKTVTQNVKFTAAGTMDKVTGKLVTLNADGSIANEDGKLTWTPDSATLDGVNSPVVPNYHVVSVSSDSKDGVNVDPITVNHDSVDSTVVVKYAPNGHIIPVDPDGNEIPGAPHPQYPTDPKNPAGVVPNEPTPNVPGYTTPTKEITPEDPGKDTPVVYTKNEGKVPGDAPTVTNPEAAVITVNYIDQTDNNKVLASEKLAGEDGSAIDTNSVDTKIADYENEGYVLVSNGFEAAGKDFTTANNGKTYDVIFKHGTEPVNPNHPGKPGEPLNPKDPEAKFPDGTAKTDLEKTVTRTITYVATGEEAYIKLANGEHRAIPFNTPKTVTQDVKFTAEGIIDKVTGNLVTVDAAGNITSQNGKLTWTPEDGTLAGVNSPVVDSYHVVSVSADSKDGVNVDETTVNHDSNNIDVVVTYAANGHFIPVDPNGNPIPNVPVDTPPYTTDPKNPAGVVPNEPVPNIPGYTPNTPTKTPEDPGKDTPVTYTKNPEAAVINVRYIDQTDDNKVLDSTALAGEIGSAIDAKGVDTKITNYENEGYVLVSNGFEAAGKDFTDTNNGKTYDVVFKHGTEPVNPQHPGKPGEPLNPNDPEAKFPDGTAKTDLEKTVTRTITYVANGEAEDHKFVAPKAVTQNIKFTAEGIIDKVTGNLVTVDAAGNITSQEGKLTWTPEDGTLEGVNSPVVKYYHVVSVSTNSKHGVNVDSVTVNHDSKNIDVVVTYAPNGHIIPVDPQGNPIPNVPVDTPPYPNDPTNPSKVVPNVPVPVIPGYIPDIPEVPGKDQTVPTPPNPSDNKKVTYIKQDNPPVVNNDEVAGVVSYIDDTTGKTLDTVTLEGKVGEKITYTTNSTITKYENEGYDFVSSNFVNGDETFTNGSNVFEVHFNEGTVPVNPQNPGKPGEPLNPNDPEGNGPKYPDGTGEKDLNKTITRTIKFVDNNGKEVAKSITQPAHFTASGVLNKVTGKWVTPLTWSPKGEDLSSVNVPVVEKQHVVSIDKDGNGLTSVKGVTVTVNDSDYTVTVTYAPNGHIVPVDPNGNPIPNAPQPQYPTDPKNPSGVVPNEPVPDVPGYVPAPHAPSTVTPHDPGENTPVPYVPVEPGNPETPTDPNPTPQPHPQPTPDVEIPDEPTPEDPSIDVPMPHPQTPEVPEEPEGNTPAPHASVPEEPVSVKELPAVHANKVSEDVPMPHATQETLPQTGEKTSVVGLIAGALASILGVIGLASRRKEDK